MSILAVRVRAGCCGVLGVVCVSYLFLGVACSFFWVARKKNRIKNTADEQTVHTTTGTEKELKWKIG